MNLKMRKKIRSLAVGALLLVYLINLASCGNQNTTQSSDIISKISGGTVTSPPVSEKTNVDNTTDASDNSGKGSESYSYSTERKTEKSISNSKTDIPTTKTKVTDKTTASMNITTSTKDTTQTTSRPSGDTIDFRSPGDKNTVGVWWWSIGTIKGSTGQKWLDYCIQNNVSEIYLCIDGMNQSGATSFADVRSFVKKASDLGLRVAALTGSYKWIEPSNIGFQSYVNKFELYQSQASNDEKFYSMHLDVEPHQHPDFKTGSAGRAKIMQWFADFAVNKAVPAAKAAGTLLEWDIPFWMADKVKDPTTGSDIILAELMAKICDTICIMSYRDTAKAMYDVSKEEIEFAKKYGTKIVLGAETYSTEGDSVSYMEEGKIYMVSELKKLNSTFLSEFTNQNFGIAIHQIQRWYDLKK